MERETKGAPVRRGGTDERERERYMDAERMRGGGRRGGRER